MKFGASDFFPAPAARGPWPSAVPSARAGTDRRAAQDRPWCPECAGSCKAPRGVRCARSAPARRACPPAEARHARRGLDALHGDRLVQPQRRLRHQREPLRERVGVLHQLIVRHHPLTMPMRSASCRVEVIAGQPPAVGVLPATQRRHQEARVGDVPHLRLGEHRLVGRNRDVGGELVPEATAHGPAVDRGDDRRAKPPHVLPLPRRARRPFGANSG